MKPQPFNNGDLVIRSKILKSRHIPSDCIGIAKRIRFNNQSNTWFFDFYTKNIYGLNSYNTYRSLNTAYFDRILTPIEVFLNLLG